MWVKMRPPAAFPGLIEGVGLTVSGWRWLLKQGGGLKPRLRRSQIITTVFVGLSGLGRRQTLVRVPAEFMY